MILSAADQQRIERFWDYCQKHQYFNIGYPESADFDYSALYRFFNFSLNNCGDWRESSNYALNSFDFEHDVMQFFAELFQISLEESWGYVTNGGTEGNMFACYLARELWPESTLYYSDASHYSVAKIAKLLKIKTCVVATLANGEVDVEDLIKKIHTNHEKHPIIFANIGTTMTGAIDPITYIQTRLAQLGIPRRDYYLHADAALSGMILPFVDRPQAFSFADGIDSICVSGHKMIGSPIPCGIVLAKQEYIERISVDVDYIAARDQTISGSRNGHTVLLMWAALRGQTFLQQKQRVERCLDMAQYTVERFQIEGIQAWRHRNSITVVFPSPSEAVCKRHYLAASADTAHLITTAHHKDTQHINRVIQDVAHDIHRKIQRTA